MDPATLSQVDAELRDDEGVKRSPYFDSKGILTVGVGRNLKDRGFATAECVALLAARGFGAVVCSSLGPRGCKWLAIGALFDVPLADAEIQLLLDNDIRIVGEAARRIFPAFPTFTGNRQAALCNMLFMGETRFSGFHDLIAAVRAGDWSRAADEALDSKWAKKDVQHSRSARVAQQLRLG